MIFEAPLMKRLHGFGLGTGTSLKHISPDEKAMLWSSQQFGTFTTHETSRNNNIQLSNTFQLCLCTYSICLYYYDDIQIQSACIMIV